MSKLFKILAVLALVAGAVAIAPGPALAQHHGGHGHWHGGGHGGWHGGGWGPGFGLGLGLGYTWGYPYYGSPYYYGPAPNCGWVRVRVWRGGHWVLRRAWRCW